MARIDLFFAGAKGRDDDEGLKNERSGWEGSDAGG